MSGTTCASSVASSWSVSEDAPGDQGLAGVGEVLVVGDLHDDRDFAVLDRLLELTEIDEEAVVIVIVIVIVVAIVIVKVRALVLDGPDVLVAIHADLVAERLLIGRALGPTEHELVQARCRESLCEGHHALRGFGSLHGFQASLRNKPYRYVCLPCEPVDVSEDWRRIGSFGHPDLGDLPTARR
jgi:hypothetical protein